MGHPARCGAGLDHPPAPIAQPCRVNALVRPRALLFVLQFPERWFPDKFDLWLSSHQLWHVCVLAAVVSWSSFCEGYVLESCA